MNEPAIFYSREGLQERLADAPVMDQEGLVDNGRQTLGWLHLSNHPEDYKRFYHKVNGKMVRHDQVHNLFGYNMTRAASEGLAKIAPGKRFFAVFPVLLHRDAPVRRRMDRGQPLLVEPPAAEPQDAALLNMCGFLYVGADLGGFNADTTRDLLLRWLALGVFTPLMRNHSGSDTRRRSSTSLKAPRISAASSRPATG